MQTLGPQLHWRLLIQRTAIPTTLDERHARHRRVARQLLDGETERTADQAMNQQLVLIRIDVGNAVV